MHWTQIIITALVQGITELFPISSVGHAVILPYLFGWSDILNSKVFLPFVVMLHLGTALALLLYFWKDWVQLISSLFTTTSRKRSNHSKKILGLIVVATIPAAIIGKLLEHKFQELFPSALSAGIFLLINGAILLTADRLRRRAGSTKIIQISYGQSFLIGIIQAFALIPGISRSGITMTAGLGLGLSYEESARFSFLLATPVILGAGVLEVPKMLHAHTPHMMQYGIIGGLLAGVVAYISTAFLMKYFQTHEVSALRPFAYYCVILGVVTAAMSALGLQF